MRSRWDTDYKMSMGLCLESADKEGVFDVSTVKGSQFRQRWWIFRRQRGLRRKRLTLCF
jgi:hypothetical protein